MWNVGLVDSCVKVPFFILFLVLEVSSRCLLQYPALVTSDSDSEEVSHTRGVAQMVERSLSMREVPGSKPGYA